ncbi:MAG TPA: response regulator transcription factor [Candidatus Limnocylindrales bacterium]|nr:response regulator transcription factor [Candidatus Limnocylindrales bacterium]
MKEIRIVIADDHALFRQGLRSLLRLRQDITVIAETDRAADLPAILARGNCDILLLDLQMERNALLDVSALAKRVAVIVVTASERPEDMLGAVRAGARALVLKRFAVETLLEAIDAVGRGHVHFPPEVQELLAAGMRTPDQTSVLTQRELEIVRCVAGGMRNAEVARALFITEQTVKSHLNNVFQKLAIRDRVELTLFAVRTGIVGTSQPQR